MPHDSTPSRNLVSRAACILPHREIPLPFLFIALTVCSMSPDPQPFLLTIPSVPRWLSQVVNFAEACPHCGQDPAGGSTLHCHPCGEQLVQQGHVALEELQRLAIAVSENAQATTDPKYWSSIAPAWYHACAISMASLYANEAWSSFDPDAVRPLVDSANTGLPWPTRLDAIENRIAVVDFEVFSLLPILLSLSLEVNDFGVRERIVALYNSIIAKGYAAGTFLRDGLTYLQSISLAQSQLSLVGSSGSL